MLTKKEREMVMDIVESDGLLYALIDYSTFPEITDKRFRAAVTAFEEAVAELKYLLKME